MARLALVSRNALMAMGLSAADHEVVEVRVGEVDPWLLGSGPEDVDALVLDVGTPTEALRVVGDLRDRGHWLPVLLIASHDTGWDDPALAALPRVDVLVLPINAPKLTEAVDSLLTHPAAASPPVLTDEAAALLEPLPPVPEAAATAAWGPPAEDYSPAVLTMEPEPVL
ncbi:MAG: hypothetical protein OEV62_05695, partial [Actinomycetota bacterium]|nr:hypothetical protein [Actinomycetota bacterium]